jgi:hypothetical protein
VSYRSCVSTSGEHNVDVLVQNGYRMQAAGRPCRQCIAYSPACDVSSNCRNPLAPTHAMLEENPAPVKRTTLQPNLALALNVFFFVCACIHQ